MAEILGATMPYSPDHAKRWGGDAAIYTGIATGGALAAKAINPTGDFSPKLNLKNAARLTATAGIVAGAVAGHTGFLTQNERGIDGGLQGVTAGVGLTATGLAVNTMWEPSLLTNKKTYGYGILAALGLGTTLGVIGMFTGSDASKSGDAGDTSDKKHEDGSSCD